MITRFFKFLALIWYADEYGWPEEETPSPSARSAPSFDPLLGSGGLPLEQGNEQ